MATKTISITEDAYKRLLSLKKANESFSLVIQKMTGGSILSSIQGILSKESADKLEKVIKRNREKNFQRRKLRIKRIEESLK